jgi:hypothetical protein
VTAYIKTYNSEWLNDPQWCKDDFDSKVGDDARLDEPGVAAFRADEKRSSHAGR